jgi:hypothetical protein
MTTIVVWVGIDSHGPSSAYIASDSRFSWKSQNRIDTWNHGRKTFASARYPDVAGYWGDVLFPVVTLSQFFANLDSGVVAQKASLSNRRFQALEQLLHLSFSELSDRQRRPFAVVYASRDGNGMEGTFHVRTVSWSVDDGWARKTFRLPSASGAIHLSGSGAAVARLHLAKWSTSTEGGTSRAVYSAFIDGLRSGADHQSGGPPQLVGLYRIGPGRSFGTLIGRDRFLNGMPVAARSVQDEIEWRNELFERVSGRTRMRLPLAQRHAQPFQPASPPPINPVARSRDD